MCHEALQSAKYISTRQFGGEMSVWIVYSVEMYHY